MEFKNLHLSLLDLYWVFSLFPVPLFLFLTLDVSLNADCNFVSASEVLP